MYRAKPVTQRDGSPQQFSNCRLASGASGLDFQTQGAKRSTGEEMRKRSGDPSGGTTSDDAARAFKSYDEPLAIGDGRTWADALDLLLDGHLVHIDVWHQTTGGPCMSGSGRYGHTMAIAPEQSSSGKWLCQRPLVQAAQVDVVGGEAAARGCRGVVPPGAGVDEGQGHIARRCGAGAADPVGPRSPGAR